MEPIFDTVALSEEGDAILILDQTQLPNRMVQLRLTTQKQIFDAIRRLQVRGAPAIGVTAAMGLYLAVREADTADPAAFRAQFQQAKAYLAGSRPTAVNLFWALNRMEAVLSRRPDASVADLKAGLLREAEAIRDEDIRVCRRIGEYGLSLIHDGDGLLTHCNAGRLAAVRYGTATAPMYVGQERGLRFHIYADETRPLLQGARLTAYELHAAGMDVTLLCDNMAASAMRAGKIQAVFVGCDRVAANGDTANKIGTSMVALAARQCHVPFYVCAPVSTIDLSTPAGEGIPIEQRAPEEVTELWYQERMAPQGVSVYNPAFDVTDADLIDGFVTEYGVVRPPYDTAFREICARAERERNFV